MPHTWGLLSCRERLLWEHLKVLPWPGSPSDSRRYTVCLAETLLVSSSQECFYDHPGHACQRWVTSLHGVGLPGKHQ